MTTTKESGWTLIGVIITIAIIGILSAIALPRFANQSSNAKIATLQGIASAIKTTAAVMKSKALLAGLTPSTTPSAGSESLYIVETEAGLSEVDYRNLCPESRAELGDKLTIIDLIGLEHSNTLDIKINNRFTQIGYDIRGNGNSPPSGTQGCFVSYDSFASPDCTIVLVIADC
ncbi:MAG: hypothetical protein KBT77_06460 [Thalassolituus oleivorans]|uniref:hypothetical protein n=1 Tax=Thalassolituus oleivorans TaxID=187493 RepID=UPI001B69FA55|nr:hypothetical protein [Thalassolituus oleivorans]MBQ0726975.1 hypothetical protein [Thalassolituus oleivorans]MBQ0781212.1 hypothetical protein [Thalassolituus oleivorans]